MGRKKAGGRDAWIEAGLLLLISLAVVFWYSLTEGNPLLWDEYYHLLAARSWAETGTLAIGEGAYARGAWLSVSVGWLFRNFGESIFLARLPGAIALCLWVLAVFLPVRALVGRTAAWVASLALLLSPVVLINSVMVRFYGIAGLLFWLACMGAFLAAFKRRPPLHTVSLTLASLCLFGLCYEITPLTRLWTACFALWLIGVALFEGAKSRHRLRIFGGSAILLSIAGVWVYQSGWLPDLWSFYRRVPTWSFERGSDLRWYEGLFRKDYPTLWTLLPVAAVLSVARRPMVGMMCVVSFSTGIVFLSLGGAKAERYLIPLMPFFFVLWGIAVAELIPALRNRVSSLMSLSPVQLVPTWLAQVTGHAFLAVIFGFVLLTNPGFTRVRHVLGDQAISLDRPTQGDGASPTAWKEVAITLRPLLDEVEVVITSNSIQTLYHVGSYDFAIRPTVIGEIQPPSDFGIDRRTGRPAISTLESLILIVSRHTHGLVFGESWRWRHPVEGFTDEVTDYIVASMELVPLADDLGVIAYRW